MRITDTPWGLAWWDSVPRTVTRPFHIKGPRVSHARLQNHTQQSGCKHLLKSVPGYRARTQKQGFPLERSAQASLGRPQGPGVGRARPHRAVDPCTSHRLSNLTGTLRLSEVSGRDHWAPSQPRHTGRRLRKCWQCAGSLEVTGPRLDRGGWWVTWRRGQVDAPHPSVRGSQLRPRGGSQPKPECPSSDSPV